MLANVYLLWQNDLHLCIIFGRMETWGKTQNFELASVIKIASYDTALSRSLFTSSRSLSRLFLQSLVFSLIHSRSRYVIVRLRDFVPKFEDTRVTTLIGPSFVATPAPIQTSITL